MEKDFQMILGVSWSGQLVYALTSFAFGFGGGVIARLYFIKGNLNKIEQGLVDFLATMLLALLYLVSVEIGGKGQLTAYSLCTFLLGIWLFSFLWRKIAHSLRTRWRGRKPFKK